MAVIWYKLVKSGKKTIDQVPSTWRDEVEKMLEEDQAPAEPASEA